MRRRGRGAWLNGTLGVGALALLVLTACAPTLPQEPRPTPPAATPSQAGPAAPLTPAPDVPGDPNRGYALVMAKGCGGCHTIRGIPNALGVAGPNLTNVTLRPTLAGEQARMSPQTLTAWLVDPAAVK